MKPHIPKIDLNDYSYLLPENRIAKHPLDKRDESKLLHYRQGEIKHHTFKQLPELLPDHSTLFFNNTKVIHARLVFHKSSGARIEVFLLEPISPHKDVATAMSTRSSVVWKCMIGNLKRWKKDDILTLEFNNLRLEAVIQNHQDQTVELTWNSNHTFAEVVEKAGEIPLPPYLRRNTTETDKISYQTVYSKNEGAVAAPTAGLHFTATVLEELEDKGFHKSFLTLHVSAGTFQPINVKNVEDHPMHSEQVIITKKSVEDLLNCQGSRIAVGTTSMRTLESLYWYGVKLKLNEDTDFFIEKLYPYEKKGNEVTLSEALNAVLDHMDKENLVEISGATEIFLFPGYEFRIVQGLITNFHLPGSTLILLIAAFIGEGWKTVYEQALDNNYRFLSYGDSSLLIP